MSESHRMAPLDELLTQLKSADWKQREQIKEQLLEVVRGFEPVSAARDHLDAARRGLPLEARWEVDEVLEATAPQPEAPEEPDDAESPAEDEAADDPNRPLTMSDLTLVYDDPRGLAVYKAKRGDRWFAMQPDPYTGQPQMIPLQPQQVDQLKTQLAGSPYWVLGSGEAPSV